MTRPSLGITAMELFACNPFRVLGIAVDTPTADVTLTYKKLLDMAAKGDTADYETPYDFDFLHDRVFLCIFMPKIVFLN